VFYVFLRLFFFKAAVVLLVCVASIHAVPLGRQSNTNRNVNINTNTNQDYNSIYASLFNQLTNNQNIGGRKALDIDAAEDAEDVDPSEDAVAVIAEDEEDVAEDDEDVEQEAAEDNVEGRRITQHRPPYPNRLQSSSNNYNSNYNKNTNTNYDSIFSSLFEQLKNQQTIHGKKTADPVLELEDE